VHTSHIQLKTNATGYKWLYATAEFGRSPVHVTTSMATIGNLRHTVSKLIF